MNHQNQNNTKPSKFCEIIKNIYQTYPNQFIKNIYTKYCPDNGSVEVYFPNKDNNLDIHEYEITMNEKKNKPECVYYKTLYNIIRRNHSKSTITDYYDFMEMMELKTKAKFYILHNCDY